MKKVVFITLLSISVAAIAVTSGHSQQSGIISADFSNIADTTPKTHHTMMKKPVHDSTMHKTVTKTKTKMKPKTKKPVKDSTSKK
ncbi:MAG TPA: hypothetical protein VHB70_00015 [Parafilimonas sp.]|nr:hypothetical protein [Parafilimonas sp.]